MTVLRVFVPGVPVPQGSKDAHAVATGRGEHRRYTGRVALVESAKGHEAWRKQIVQACTGDDNQPRARFGKKEPVRVVCVFVMPRTKSMRKTTPPHVVKPDGDKLLRAVCDALTTAGVYHDDAQVVEHNPRKRYARPGEPTGVHIDVWHDTGTYPEEHP